MANYVPSFRSQYFIFTAEKFLESVEGNQNYPVLLLHIMDKADVEPHIRVSSVVMFKNYIKRNWRVVSLSLVNLINKTVLLRDRKRRTARAPPPFSKKKIGGGGVRGRGGGGGEGRGMGPHCGKVLQCIVG